MSDRYPLTHQREALAVKTHDLRLEMVRPNVPAPPTGNSETRCRVIYVGRELGVWRDPEHSAARFLLDNGLAERGDMLRTFRGEKLCMTGGVGWFADRRTLEDDTRGPVTVKWRPFPEGLRAVGHVLAGQASNGEPVIPFGARGTAFEAAAGAAT